MGELFLPINVPLDGEIEVPGDKSISHRAVIFASLAKGTSNITHFLDGEDCMRTVDVFRSMGVVIEKQDNQLIVEGKGLGSLKEPNQPLYFGNSGTTARLMCGLLAGLPFFSVVYGDVSLTQRPMDRIVIPLKQMNAQIEGRNEGKNLPLSIRGRKLKGMTYELPVKSAQVKSALLFAGLNADGPTTIIEKTPTRNHTENMLQAFGANLEIEGDRMTIQPGKDFTAQDIFIPGDISSAAFFMVAAAIIPNSQVTLKNVGLNKTRTGILEVLTQMGGKLIIENETSNSGEPMGDITVMQSTLKGIIIEGEIIPRLIDEIPIIALLATQADGKTIIRNAKELRVKETDRIKAIVEVLQTMGASIESTDDGMIIHGKTTLTGGKVSSYGDHRIAMMCVVASLIVRGEIELDESQSIAISYPNFFDDLKKLTSSE
ncbi:3-phosphoshikimate 1-carboxyvinyltransferase [Oceanobacillus limi]|uniref:3-phosphoshikimate 1-carboxyvinyltransferase n=1 Tax=Oceanobacillus limi TaxID=930131 RepID=A0A1H9ZGM1_9BACI|nr:3-phosphoshikimate 1-carboxyvinyltransferase [Oceanobacillus limi]SES80468.1 3-phosphoshikimate 1-carboxyvinyltransferase [Oceanobacillus limi]